jgi:hypothetical protein
VISTAFPSPRFLICGELFGYSLVSTWCFAFAWCFSVFCQILEFPLFAILDCLFLTVLCFGAIGFIVMFSVPHENFILEL